MKFSTPAIAIVAAALSGTTTAAPTAASHDSTGAIKVHNKCPFQIDLTNVPAYNATVNGGYSKVEQNLLTNQMYVQPWTSLASDGGWSVKLEVHKQPGSLVQFEYHLPPGVDRRVWFDVSHVDTQRKDFNCKLDVDASHCASKLKQTSYRYDTDDDNGSQDCLRDAIILMTLCEGQI